ncbi:hypothetical protein BN1200_1190003 [Klebsiella variicola]|nr:hypothetical protein BN1200_1190003 [Klebsiella variicola]
MLMAKLRLLDAFNLYSIRFTNERIGLKTSTCAVFERLLPVFRQSSDVYSFPAELK